MTNIELTKNPATSTDTITTSVDNNATITKPASTEYETITPPTATTTETKWLTRTRRTWTKSEDVITEIVVPSCTVPPPQQTSDPACVYEPKSVPLPRGIHIPGHTKGKRPMDVAAVRQRFERHWRSNHKRSQNRRNTRAAAARVKRDIDSATTTITATETANATHTVYGPTSTDQDITIVTLTSTVILPPKTVDGGEHAVVTTWAPTPWETEHVVRRTRVFVTKTLHVTRTETTTTTPGPEATACKEKGGRFGEGWRHWRWERRGGKGGRL